MSVTVFFFFNGFINEKEMSIVKGKTQENDGNRTVKGDDCDREVDVTMRGYNFRSLHRTSLRDHAGPLTDIDLWQSMHIWISSYRCGLEGDM